MLNLGFFKKILVVNRASGLWAQTLIATTVVSDIAIFVLKRDV